MNTIVCPSCNIEFELGGVITREPEGKVHKEHKSEEMGAESHRIYHENQEPTKDNATIAEAAGKYAEITKTFSMKAFKKFFVETETEGTYRDTNTNRHYTLEKKQNDKEVMLREVF